MLDRPPNRRALTGKPLKQILRCSNWRRVIPESYRKFSARGTELISKLTVLRRVFLLAALVFYRDPTLVRHVASILFKERHNDRKRRE